MFFWIFLSDDIELIILHFYYATQLPCNVVCVAAQIFSV